MLLVACLLLARQRGVGCNDIYGAFLCVVGLIPCFRSNVGCFRPFLGFLFHDKEEVYGENMLPPPPYFACGVLKGQGFSLGRHGAKCCSWAAQEREDKRLDLSQLLYFIRSTLQCWGCHGISSAIASPRLLRS